MALPAPPVTSPPLGLDSCLVPVAGGLLAAGLRPAGHREGVAARGGRWERVTLGHGAVSGSCVCPGHSPPDSHLGRPGRVARSEDAPAPAWVALGAPRPRTAQQLGRLSLPGGRRHPRSHQALHPLWPGPDGLPGCLQPGPLEARHRGVPDVWVPRETRCLRLQAGSVPAWGPGMLRGLRREGADAGTAGSCRGAGVGSFLGGAARSSGCRPQAPPAVGVGAGSLPCAQRAALGTASGPGPQGAVGSSGSAQSPRLGGASGQPRRAALLAAGGDDRSGCLTEPSAPAHTAGAQVARPPAGVGDVLGVTGTIATTLPVTSSPASQMGGSGGGQAQPGRSGWGSASPAKGLLRGVAALSVWGGG